MKKLTISLVACLAVTGSLYGVADTFMKLPKQIEKNPTAAQESTLVKKAAVDNSRLVDNFTKGLSLASSSDKTSVSEYLTEKGTLPVYAPSRTPYGPEDDTQYKYTGYNVGAGLSEDGTATGGLVNFNLEPFACDTVSSDAGVSPYSFVKNDKLYCAIPVTDASYNYTGMTINTYDANTLEKLETKTVDLPEKSTAYFPYIASYDSQRDMVYAISLENAKDNYGNSISKYYLNYVDMDSWQLKRIAYLGYWTSLRDSGNFNPKGMTFGYDCCYVLNSDDKQYIESLNVATGERTVIGYTDLPMQYVYGLQPIVYDSYGYLIVNHYDFNNGTVYYKVSPSVAYGSTEKVCNTTLIESAPTGFTFFYQRPETKTSFYSKSLDAISDLTVSVEQGGSTASVSMTVPSTINGGQEIEIPYWSNDRVRMWIYVDNSWSNVTLPSEIHFGDKLDFTVEGLEGGAHVLTVVVYPYYNEVATLRQSTYVCTGYDTPGEVKDATLAISDGKAVISWSAPEKGRFADFGSFFDPSDLIYTVVRDVDGKEVASNITETSCEDSDLGDIIRTYTYTIYATSHGNTNSGEQTNMVTAGSYMGLPYVNNFDKQSDLDGWNIVNVNNDGTYRTWAVNTYWHYMINPYGFNGADDWAISPGFKLEKGKLYELSYLRSMGSTEPDASLRVTIGQGNTPEDQDEVLADFDKANCDEEITRHYFTPAEDGIYNFGFYDYSVSDYATVIDSVSFKEVAVITAPAQVRQLSVVADADGAVGATVKCTLPINDIAGNKLSSLSKVTVYTADWTELASKTGVNPGEEVAIPVSAVEGNNRYFVVAANEDGKGWPSECNGYVGLDTPSAMSKVSARWGDDENVVVITWENPKVGVNGGYVNPDDFVYSIYKYDTSSWPFYTKLGETSSDENEIEISLMDVDTTVQDYYIFGLTASNAKGESDYTKVGIMIGDAYELPYVEQFTMSGVSHQPYLTSPSDNGSNWAIDAGYYNANVTPYDEGVDLVAVNATTGADGCGFVSPIIDFTNSKHPIFELWLHHSDAMPEGSCLAVVASVDGSSNFTQCGEAASVTGNNGWQKHIFDLSSLAGKKAQLMLYASMPDPSARIFADSWNIHEATGNDLAITGISKPYAPKVGDKAVINVTVTNLGVTTASDYSVLFNVDDNTIGEVKGEKSLGVGESAILSFELPITPNGDILYNAELLYDDDNAENNFSSEVEISPEQLNLPAPENAVLDDANQLTWTAPAEPALEETVLDFEDVPAFMVDDIDGWKTADLDGNLTLTFVQYYDNYWPYAGQKLAWMTWSPRDAGCADAGAWQPYSGDKCLVHFGNYGVDEEGRSSDTPDNDWFISPEVVGGTNFSFMISATEILAKVEVLSSSTTRDPEAFTNVLSTYEVSTAYDWNEVKVTLPADAKYVAIRTLNDPFGILIDDVHYTQNRLPVFQGYNVYRNKSAAWFGTETSWQVPGDGKFAVSAVYDLGESALTNEVETSGVNNVLGGLQLANVKCGKGYITVNGCSNSNILIATASGQTVASTRVASGATWKVPAGVYVVSVDGKTYKVMVK